MRYDGKLSDSPVRFEDDGSLRYVPVGHVPVYSGRIQTADYYWCFYERCWVSPRLAMSRKVESFSAVVRKLQNQVTIE